ncbi:hypothetical protein FQN50_007460 [Emmonsiellopsis sp. PD_5]|nr:hypothetical protein FQN50_007460 [Emmonsiellopsis sp. PD_5]
MSTHLKPTSSSRHSSQSHSSHTPKPTAPPSYKPPLTTHPSATISDSASFQGTHPITIGAGTVIHPRTKFLSFEGPIRIGEACIIGEKSVIGGPLAAPSSATTTAAAAAAAAAASPYTDSAAEATTTTKMTILENSILLAPLTTISAGAHISAAATVDTSAVLGRRVRVGRHAKVCANCWIPDDGVVGDWVVIWGGGSGGGRLQRRKRHGGGADGGGFGVGVGGGIVEEGRLVVLNREREGLVKLIGAGAGGGARRK